MPRTAIIAGASGLVGSCCLRRLGEAPEYSRIIALTRRPIGFRESKTEERVIDFDRPDAVSLEPEADIFCALGTTIRKAGSQEAFRRVDYGYPTALARRASAAGARRFLVVSSVAADASSSNFYLRTKGEMERDIAALPFESVHIFRPSFLVGNRAERRPGEKLGIAAAQLLGFALTGSLRKYRAIPADAVARAMVQAALHGPPGVHVHHYDDMLSSG